MAWDSTVTNAGVEMLTNVLAGGSMTLDCATAGSGTVATAALMAQTAITDEKAQFPIVTVNRVTQGQRVNIQVTNVGLTEAFQMKQVGIWAHVDDGETRLLAILQDSTGIAVPAETELEFSLNFYAVIAFEGKANFKLTVDPSTLVTVGMLKEKTGAIEKEMVCMKIIDFYIPEDAWTEDEAETGRYQWYVDVANASALASYFPNAVLDDDSLEAAYNCGMRPMAEIAEDGKIRFRAQEKPSDGISGQCALWVQGK